MVGAAVVSYIYVYVTVIIYVTIVVIVIIVIAIVSGIVITRYFASNIISIDGSS